MWVQEVTAVSELTQDFEIGLNFFLIVCDKMFTTHCNLKKNNLLHNN